jgi:Putative endonuclease segE, GIY-YIG domain/NUMOD3 motif
MIPFTYLVKHIPTNKYYYGVKFKKGCHPNDLWTKYFTSSKKVKGLIKKYGKKSFQFEIRKTFKTQKQAREWEHKVLRRLKVIYRDDFLNLSDSLHIDPKIISKSKMGNKNPMYGKKMSKKHKQKIKNTLIERYKKLPHHSKGRKHTPEFLKFLSRINKGKNNRMYGVKMSKESRKKMSIAKYKHWERIKAAI